MSLCINLCSCFKNLGLLDLVCTLFSYIGEYIMVSFSSLFSHEIHSVFMQLECIHVDIQRQPSETASL
ncbi:hypothetical protein Leryth_005482 [Lithospermum erythrorhizon]|nr:hypothetical protein Leryth_005482 [Lithospermum erythrorhizon]